MELTDDADSRPHDSRSLHNWAQITYVDRMEIIKATPTILDHSIQTYSGFKKVALKRTSNFLGISRATSGFTYCGFSGY